MRAVVPLLALLLLAGLASVGAAATLMTGEDRAAAKEAAAEEAAASKEHRPPSHLRPHEGGPRGGRGPIMTAPLTGGTQDVTGSNDEHLSGVSKFVSDHLEGLNSGLTYVQIKAEVQVVAGLVYTLRYKGNDAEGACKEERVVVVYDKAWLKERIIKSDTVTECT